MGYNPILSLAFVFILSFFFARLVRKIKIPSITAYVLLGIVLSPHALNLLSREFLATADFFSNVVLGLIAFSLGENFAIGVLRRVGKAVITISISASIVPWLLITFGLWLFFGQPFYVALLFGAIASATAPAAVVMVTQEYKSKGEFTDTLLGIVAADDAWALIIFGFSLALTKSFIQDDGGSLTVAKDLARAAVEIAGSIALGWLVAFCFNKLCRFIKTNADRLIFTCGFLLLTAGLSLALHISVLLSCMCFGAVLVNSNTQSAHFFDSLRAISQPLYLIFFVLAGASLRLSVLTTAVSLVAAYILLRAAGKIIGSGIGAYWAGASLAVKRYMGFALVPQAGVALACALVAKHAISGLLGDVILSVTIASTVIFELFGPWITKYSLEKAGEIAKGKVSSL